MKLTTLLSDKTSPKIQHDSNGSNYIKFKNNQVMFTHTYIYGKLKKVEGRGSHWLEEKEHKGIGGVPFIRWGGRCIGGHFVKLFFKELLLL